MMENSMEIKERAVLERELSQLMERTLTLENELNSVVLSRN
jgi:hypothetical protein